MAEKAQLVLTSLEGSEVVSLTDLLDLDAELRQFFDILSSQDPVTQSELTILKDVGALLNRAKTLAVEQRAQVLEQLKSLRASRSGIQAYESAGAKH